jgi:hypothetical protein
MKAFINTRGRKDNNLGKTLDYMVFEPGALCWRMTMTVDIQNGVSEKETGADIESISGHI